MLHTTFSTYTDLVFLKIHSAILCIPHAWLGRHTFVC